MKIWVVAFIVSGIVTLVMTAIFLAAALLALNGFTSMSAAMPTYLICNAAAWPLMVAVGTAVDFIIFAIAKQKQPLGRTILLNAAIVTIVLATSAILLSIS